MAAATRHKNKPRAVYALGVVASAVRAARSVGGWGPPSRMGLLDQKIGATSQAQCRTARDYSPTRPAQATRGCCNKKSSDWGITPLGPKVFTGSALVKCARASSDFGSMTAVSACGSTEHIVTGDKNLAKRARFFAQSHLVPATKSEARTSCAGSFRKRVTLVYLQIVTNVTNGSWRRIELLQVKNRPCRSRAVPVVCSITFRKMGSPRKRNARAGLCVFLMSTQGRRMMRKIVLVALAAGALIATAAAPAMAQVGAYVGPGGVGVGIGPVGVGVGPGPGYYDYGAPYHGYYNYAPGRYGPHRWHHHYYSHR